MVFEPRFKKLSILFLSVFFLFSAVTSLYAASDSSVERERVRAQKLIQQEAKEAERQNQTRINNLYKEALSFYYNNNLRAAKETFELILLISPDERKAKSFIDSKIPAREKKLAQIRERELGRLRINAAKEAEANKKRLEKGRLRAELQAQREDVLRDKELARERKIAQAQAEREAKIARAKAAESKREERIREAQEVREAKIKEAEEIIAEIEEIKEESSEDIDRERLERRTEVEEYIYYKDGKPVKVEKDNSGDGKPDK